MSTRRAEGRRLVDCVLLENGVICVALLVSYLPTCGSNNGNRMC